MLELGAVLAAASLFKQQPDLQFLLVRCGSHPEGLNAQYNKGNSCRRDVFVSCVFLVVLQVISRRRSLSLEPPAIQSFAYIRSKIQNRTMASTVGVWNFTLLLIVLFVSSVFSDARAYYNYQKGNPHSVCLRANLFLASLKQTCHDTG